MILQRFFFLVYSLSQDFLPHIFLEYSVIINWFRRCLFHSMKNPKISPLKSSFKLARVLYTDEKINCRDFLLLKRHPEDNVEILCKVFRVISDREKMSSFQIVNIRIRRKSVFIPVDFYEGQNYNI